MTADGAAPCAVEPAVRIDLLRLQTKHFALKVDNWSAPPGACVAFIGRNGSGKSTVLDSLLGLRKDAKLSGSLLGHDVREWRRRAGLRQRLGVLLQRATLPYGLYVRDVIALHRNIYRRSSNDILEALGVPELSKKTYEHLSRGEQQRVELFLGLAHEPDLIVLDEPFTGLDQRFARATADILRGFRNSTVLMACHSELELSLADTVVWMERGSIRESGNPQALRRQLLGDYRLHASFHEAQEAEAFARLIGERASLQFVRVENGTEVLAGGEESVLRSAPSLVAEGRIAALQYGPTSLTDLLYRCAHAELPAQSGVS
jgi:ABC-2 type transport system ATP-binding protein